MYVVPSTGFLNWYAGLDEDKLKNLKQRLSSSGSTTCLGTGCRISLLKDIDTKKRENPVHNRGNPRIDVGGGKKKAVTWVVCAVNGILPPPGEDCECSHMCALDDCISPEHLTWESKSCNQSRGSRGEGGVRLCSHMHESGITVCEKYGFHKPNCIIGKGQCICKH